MMLVLRGTCSRGEYLVIAKCGQECMVRACGIPDTNVAGFAPRTDRERTVFIGCAGWSIPKQFVSCFSTKGSHLSRYAQLLNAVEVNSSFYRPHRPKTYSRWGQSVPPGFRFSVKMPKEVTHERRLIKVENALDRFCDEVARLGTKLGPLLVQLPPSLPFSLDVAEKFFIALRDRFEGYIALEPRHASWFEADAEQLLIKHRVSRVAADPGVISAASCPGGWSDLVYYRLHGSPKIYYSAYSIEFLEGLSRKLLNANRSALVWCIFDNTALGAATANALDLRDRTKS